MTEQIVTQLPVSSLVFGRANVRKRIGDVEELRASIQQVGILQPILVRPLVDGRYEVIAGRRRVTVARELGLEMVPAIIREMNNGDAIVASLVENIQRGDLDIDEEGEAYEYLYQIHGSYEKVAKAIGKSTRHIQKVLDALAALRKLREISYRSGEPAIEVVSRPPKGERREGLALPARHASDLQAIWLTVENEIPPEERERRYIALAQAIAPRPYEEAVKILREFKIRPNAPLDEIVSRALFPEEVRAPLPLATARQLHQIAEERGIQRERVAEEAIRTYIAAQEKLRELPVQGPPENVVTEALELYIRQQRREARLAQQREAIQQILSMPSSSIPIEECRVIIGDAQETLPQIPSDSVDLIVTSPPYFGLKEYGHNLGIETENLDGYLNDLRVIFTECFRVLRNGRFACVVVGQFTSDVVSVYLPGLIANLLESIGYHFRREHIWMKPLGTQGIWNRGTTAFLNNPWPRNTMINIHHEHVLIFQKGEKPEVLENRDPLTEEEIKEFCWSVWELPPSEIKDHPAPFPIEIPRRLIKMYSYTGEVVLDPFLGSGTTLQAAVNLRRAGIGIEVADMYLPLIQRAIPGARIIRYDKGEPIG